MARLRVLQAAANNRTKLDESTEREIWQLSGQSGPRDSWYRAQVTLASSTPFKVRKHKGFPFPISEIDLSLPRSLSLQLRLEATVGESGYGDIAIDSFRIENGSCPGDI